MTFCVLICLITLKSANTYYSNDVIRKSGNRIHDSKFIQSKILGYSLFIAFT